MAARPSMMMKPTTILPWLVSEAASPEKKAPIPKKIMMKPTTMDPTPVAFPIGNYRVMLRESRYLSVTEMELCGDPLKSEILVSWRRLQDAPLLLE
jgi:hypothetical protein